MQHQQQHGHGTWSRPDRDRATVLRSPAARPAGRFKTGVRDKTQIKHGRVLLFKKHINTQILRGLYVTTNKYATATINPHRLLYTFDNKRFGCRPSTYPMNGGVTVQPSIS